MAFKRMFYENKMQETTEIGFRGVENIPTFRFPRWKHLQGISAPNSRSNTEQQIFIAYNYHTCYKRLCGTMSIAGKGLLLIGVLLATFPKRMATEASIVIAEDFPACFRRLVTGRSLVERYIRKTIFCDSLRSCEEACSQEQQFNCEGFNFRFDRLGYESKCELTSVPTTLLDVTSDFNSDRNVDFFEKDRDAPRSCFNPYSSYRPWNRYGGGGPPQHTNPWDPGLEPPPPYPEDVYRPRPHRPQNQDDYYRPRPQHPGDKIYAHEYDHSNHISPQWSDKRYDGPGVHPPTRYPSYPAGGGGWPSPDECFVRTKSGFRLDKAVVIVSLTTRSLYDCEQECSNERKFSCNIFSFRYSLSPSVPGDNCHLGERVYRSLDPYTDIIPDRDYDIYERNPYRRDGCQPKKHWGSECFERVRSGLKLDDTMIKFALKASSLSECELACIRIPYFTCRAFSYRYGPPVIGRDSDNCLLTDWTISEMDPRKHLVTEPECELYNRGSYGHGCEINRYHDPGGSYGRPQPPVHKSPYHPPHHHSQYDNDIRSTYLPPERLPNDYNQRHHYQANRPHVDYSPPYKPLLPSGDYHSQGKIDKHKGAGNYPPPPRPPPPGLDRLPGGYFKDDDKVSFAGTFPPDRHTGPPIRPDNFFPKDDWRHHGGSGGYHGDRGGYYQDDRRYHGGSGGYRGGSGYGPPTGSGYGIGRPEYRTRPNDQLCYIRYSTPARLLPSAIRTSLRVPSEQECKAECTRIREKTMFRCATISYRGNHCELSDIEQRDLRPSYDYLPDKEDYWMFTWDFGTPRCYSPPMPGKWQTQESINHDFFGNQYEDDRGLDSLWSRFTVNGQPCRTGTFCRQNPDVGVWTCPVDNGDWDYCCRSGHHCGYTDGFPYPWCYVGSAAKDQWRPCSDSYYPYTHSGRKLHWPVAYLHTEGPPNITIPHHPSIVDTFLDALLKNVDKNGLLSSPAKDSISNITVVDLGVEPRKDGDSSPLGTAMKKLWTWGQSKYNNTGKITTETPDQKS
ncbi:hypothetical protein AAG570_010568 [Ranatra chinensis]|uniref:Apple domain-containing protein n=1 Tax=Ranatra chinensis TaxID=642074 RepID=A0ABD0YMX8_9HEMI